MTTYVGFARYIPEVDAWIYAHPGCCGMNFKQHPDTAGLIDLNGDVLRCDGCLEDIR